MIGYCKNHYHITVENPIKPALVSRRTLCPRVEFQKLYAERQDDNAKVHAEMVK